MTRRTGARLYGLRNAGNVKPDDEINIIKPRIHRCCAPSTHSRRDIEKKNYAQQSAPKAEAVKK